MKNQTEKCGLLAARETTFLFEKKHIFFQTDLRILWHSWPMNKASSKIPTHEAKINSWINRLAGQFDIVSFPVGYFKSICGGRQFTQFLWVEAQSSTHALIGWFQGLKNDKKELFFKNN